MRNRLIAAANVAVFAILIFIALEMTFRVYLFGAVGLNPVKVNSFVNILYSGLVQPADNLEVWYELKPDQNTVFRGASFRTNSHGLADIEYPYEKPPNTFRVAVVGSSWTMGAGVDIANAFHSVLEKELALVSGSMRYEFLNFGVEVYGLQEIVGTAKHKAMRYDPDMILFVVTGFTPNIRWNARETAFVPPPRENTGWTSYAALRLSELFGIERDTSGDKEGLIDLIKENEHGLYSKQLQKAFSELAELGKARGIPVAAAWLRLNEKGAADSNLANIFLKRADNAGMTGAVVDLEKALSKGDSVNKILVNRVEKHPNAYGHKVIADDLREKIFTDDALTSQAP